ncbi:unnamed protein product [Cuscuta europaea]|uniref:Pentatricopeptide repeat-containing protein n=1 Tax=Cuscuta europaea TaxID=41803 RepID=A0A9P0YUH3_CUSEU|nr:unnamed protein product [Cuscuta europaea]
MAVLINSPPPWTNTASGLASRYPCHFMPERPKFWDCLLRKKNFSRVLAVARTGNKAQKDLAVKDHVFDLPNWTVPSNDQRRTEIKLRDAVIYLENMVKMGHKPNVDQATQLVYSLCRQNRLGKASMVMQTMVRSGCLPDASSYTFLVDFLCKKGNVGNALQLVEKMEEYGYPTGTSTYNSLIRGLCKRGSLDLCLQFIDKFIQKGLVPDAYTHSILLDATCREKGVDTAMVLLKKIAREGGTLNLVCYHVLLTGLCKERRVDEAIQLFRKLPSIGFKPNALTYNILLKSLCLEEGRLGEANELIADMASKKCSPTTGTYNLLITSHADCGRLADALSILDEMHSAGNVKPDAESYNPIIARLCREKKLGDVTKFLEEMILKQCGPSEGTYNAIAVLCEGEEEEDVQEALKLLETLRVKQLLPFNNFYRGVISSFCKKGNTYAAFVLLFGLAMIGFMPDPMIYSALIRGLCLERMVNAAVEMIRNLHETYVPNIEIFNALVHGLCKAQRTDLSLAMYEEMVMRGYKPNETTYTIIVEGLIHEEEKEMAALLLKELRREEVMSSITMQRVEMQYDLEGLSSSKL